jgi:hypothetical protein
MQLYLQSKLSFAEVAALVGRVALPDFASELRDGLNLGGGDYFQFARNGTEVLLVCNDTDHAEVYVPSRGDWPYYCYVWRGSEEVLEAMGATLSKKGVTSELADEV